ncbi:hypothetical protein [Streptomyces sp. SLBN-115]|uniref:hypothetical protein n=1 Tax=Streptomyces sp. SLBN-115 TaxID=2768453 RepID=UPI00115064C5|nr:hypothetical protein [Streptomyces sp. SLBN-115]TQJ46551.1 hypothetical protein FBY34_5948 [Streptomyces sp. SLBN-115]
MQGDLYAIQQEYAQNQQQANNPLNVWAVRLAHAVQAHRTHVAPSAVLAERLATHMGIPNNAQRATEVANIAAQLNQQGWVEMAALDTVTGSVNNGANVRNIPNANRQFTGRAINASAATIQNNRLRAEQMAAQVKSIHEIQSQIQKLLAPAAHHALNGNGRYGPGPGSAGAAAGGSAYVAPAAQAGGRAR